MHGLCGVQGNLVSQQLILRLWGFLVAVACWPGISGAALTPRWAIIAVGAPLACSLRLSTVEPPILALLLGTLWVAGISVAWTADPLTGAFDLLLLVVLGGAFLAAAEAETIEPILTGMVWGVGVSTVLIVPQLLGWSPLEQDEGVAPAGLFFNRAAFPELAAILLVWGFARRDLVAIMLTLPPVALCQSRLAVAAVGVGALAVPSLRRVALLALPAGLLLVGAVSLSGWKQHTAMVRLDDWLSIAGLATLRGHGIGTFRAMVPFGEIAHSDVLQVVVELGVLAVLPLLLAAALLMRKGGDEACRGAFAAVCFEGLFSFPLHEPATGFLAAVLAGHLARVRPVVCDGVLGGRVRRRIGMAISGDAGRACANSPSRGGVPAGPALAHDRGVH